MKKGDRRWAQLRARLYKSMGLRLLVEGGVVVVAREAAHSTSVPIDTSQKAGRRVKDTSRAIDIYVCYDKLLIRSGCPSIHATQSGLRRRLVCRV
jgi:hypothetical protein